MVWICEHLHKCKSIQITNSHKIKITIKQYLHISSHQLRRSSFQTEDLHSAQPGWIARRWEQQIAFWPRMTSRQCWLPKLSHWSPSKSRLKKIMRRIPRQICQGPPWRIHCPSRCHRPGGKWALWHSGSRWDRPKGNQTDESRNLQGRNLVVSLYNWCHIFEYQCSSLFIQFWHLQYPKRLQCVHMFLYKNKSDASILDELRNDF